MGKAAATRTDILQKAFELIYTKGYQASSIDAIIAITNVTKGAFYYHFKTKDEMGLAIIEEILKPNMLQGFIGPMQESKDPVTDIYIMIEGLLLHSPFLKVTFGCPVGNLTQEMTPWNNEFSVALEQLVHEWQLQLEKALKLAKKNGLIRKEVKENQVAYFVMSGYWGIRNFGKLTNSADCYMPYLKELKVYLNSLR